MGARAVFVGRPVLWGLAHSVRSPPRAHLAGEGVAQRLRGGGAGRGTQGEAGVTRVLELLNNEIKLAMTLLGAGSVPQITAAHIRRDASSRL